MDDQNKNLILATALSFLVILVWFFLFPPPEQVNPSDPATAQSETSEPGVASVPAAAAAGGDVTLQTDTAGDPVEDAPRLPIDTVRLTGSISLVGGRIDDLSLKDYRDTLDESADIVRLLSPAGQPGAHYALYGWAPGAGLSLEDVPGARTEWAVETGDKLTTDTDVTLIWQNTKGLTFRRTISLDADYLFTITQSVENASGASVSLAPYGVLARHGEPEGLKNFFILHEGVVRMTDGELAEIDYSDMPDFAVDTNEGARADVAQVAENGWIGFTDHFWMSTLIPAPGTAFKSVAKYDDRRDIYQTEAVLPTQTVAAGQSAQATTQLFAGAKEWETISSYQDAGIQGFIDSIDWGWFFFLTKPIFWLLHEINKLIGNMGWSIIGLTSDYQGIAVPAGL